MIALAYAAGLSSQACLAETGQLNVLGKANIFGAGHPTPPGPHGAGLLPPVFTFAGATAFTFGVIGTVTYNGGGNFYGADGGQFGPTDTNSIGGISGIVHNARRMFLTGVFLSDQEPAGEAPLRIDYSSDDFGALYPVLDQTFFIGDGLTGTGAGGVQNFFAPPGATRLFLGFADGFDFQGFPDFYDDNGGMLQVNLTATQVPEPSASVLAVSGLVLLCGSRKRVEADKVGFRI